MFKRLQSVQKAAPRRTRKAGTEPPPLAANAAGSHLQIRRSLGGSLSSYLADDCCLIADPGRRSLRSTDSRQMIVPNTHSRLGDRGSSIRRGGSMLLEQFADNTART